MTVLHLLNILDLLGSQKWQTGGQSYRFYSDESELLQQVSFVQLKDMTGSGRVILGPTKLSLPVFCRYDYTTPFEHPRFAWISKMANWRVEASLTGSIPTNQSYQLLQQASYVRLKDMT